MNQDKTQQWLPLAQHGAWKVERSQDTGMLRLHMGNQVFHLAREAYQVLWGTLTEGLDALEQAEDASRLHAGWSQEFALRIDGPQTRH